MPTSNESHELSNAQLLAWGREVLNIESQTLKLASERLTDTFAEVVQEFLNTKGKVCVSGLGKSGHVARKIAATFSSTGTPAFFLHPSEALHGDLGTLSNQDCLLAITQSGETTELIEVVKYARRIGLKVVGIGSNSQSSLGKLSHYFLSSYVDQEACALNLAPTSSTTLCLALGDALSVSLMKARNFKREDFANLHPAGKLGRRLSHVADYMQETRELPMVSAKASFFEVLQCITQKNFGMAIVMDEAKQNVLGIVTDGDLRRSLLRFGQSTMDITADRMMIKDPKWIDGQSLVEDAVLMMEQKKITALLVGDTSKKPFKLLGLLRMHDLLTAKAI